jgi:DtxR family transcriptional regulator, Mn-dependent transcriptional regulator
MPSRTIENYLKQLYLEQDAAPAKTVIPMGKLAAAMKVVPGTATTMVKALADSGLVDYAPRGGVTLTPAGKQLALHVLRRHRLVELFLVKVLGLDWAEVHDEAEELEHTVSEKVLARIDALLGHPETDPHGDPIPTAKGQLIAARMENLAESPLDTPVKIERILDQTAAFLRFAREAGLTPGSIVTIRTRSPHADALELHPKGRANLTLSRTVAAKFLVRAG